MLYPPPRSVSGTISDSSEWGYEIGCQDETCWWFNQGCTADCSTCDGLNTGYSASHCADPDPNYKPFITDDMTDYITYSMPKIDAIGYQRAISKHPWKYPGKAPVFDSCGISSGSTADNTAAGGFVVPGTQAGDRASQLPAQDKNQWNQWIAGSTAQVAMGLSANHGGGYQYRLCPADSDLTEECFQANPLQYADDTSTLFWLAEESGMTSSPLTIQAKRLEVDSPTNVWTKNPIPAYQCISGGAPSEFVHKPVDSCDGVGPMFDPPTILEDGKPLGDDFWGFNSVHDGSHSASGDNKWLPFIRDTIMVPDTPGQYVLSWRWDSEQTPQVWTNCADVYITAGSLLV